MNRDAARFSARIEAEYAVFQDFYQVLQLEQAALVQGKADELLQLTARKSALYQQLSEFGAERDRQLAAAGLKGNTSGMNAWLDAIGAEPAARKKWNQLLELARDAEQLNLSNGSLIETHLSHNRQALAVLNAAANPGSLYGRNGQISGASTGQTRDKA